MVICMDVAHENTFQIPQHFFHRIRPEMPDELPIRTLTTIEENVAPGRNLDESAEYWIKSC